MATPNTAMQISELDFDFIKTNLRNFLRSQSRFLDYDFEGAGLNILLDVLAYNTHYMAYYLNMVGNEMFLDSAVLRNSIVSHAKHLNYTPTSRRAARAIVNIVVTPTNTYTPSTLTIPRYSLFQSEAINDINYSFVTLESYNASKNVSSGTFTFSNVEIVQGEARSYTFTVTEDNTQQNFIIPINSIDTTTLKVDVYSSLTSYNTYSLADDMTTVTSNSMVYFLSEVENNQYAMYFGDNVIGKKLSNNDSIVVSFIATDGEASNKANIFGLFSQVAGIQTAEIETVSSAAGGAERETREQIKFRAPIGYTVQNRAVTLNDYQYLITKDYPNVEQIATWGGEDNDPIVYGKVFISMKPKTGYVVTSAEKERIKKEIIQTRNIISITPEIIDPEYIYMKLRSTVYYDPNKTSLSKEQMQTLVRNRILIYTATELGKFNEPFKSSRLQTYVDDSEPSIVASEHNMFLQKRFTPTLNQSKNYDLFFGASLQRGGSRHGKSFDTLYNFPSFNVIDNFGVEREAYFEEVPNAYTGVEGFNIINPGYGYEEAPTVTITGDGIGATAKATIVNGKLSKITVTNRGSNYTRAFVVIQNSDNTGASAEAIISNRYGTLRTYYFKSNGEKIIINENAGDIDYDLGKLTLTNFKPTKVNENALYPSGVLTFNMEPEVEYIVPVRNNILTLDDTDSTSISIEINSV